MNRKAGVLLPVTSLPSRYGIGCFSQEAYDFIDWLADAGQSYWQILPLGPIGPGEGANSPYQAFSAFAGSPYLISLEELIREGFLTEEECDAADMEGTSDRVNYDKLHEKRLVLLRKAYERSSIYQDAEYQQFLQDNGWWLDDYALFMALRSFFGGRSWSEWPEDIRLHWGFAVDYYRRELYFDIEFQKFMQFEFFHQWYAVKDYANKRNIQIVGDMPLYVSMNSADTWAHPEQFQLNEQNVATDISGCPPDAFAADGQIWNNPLYRWDYHRATGYSWWISRLSHSFHMFDVVRIDHFRGFESYFSIPADSPTAMTGHWEPGPGMDLFRKLEQSIGRQKVIVEDLGLITEPVRKLVAETGFPNMKVLQFAFDPEDIGAANDYLPHNYPEHCFAYTGTHDNETSAGWFAGLDAQGKQLVRDYLRDYYTPDDEMYDCLVCAALRSRAETCIIPVQDYLGLGNEARMNVPASADGNWSWRVTPGALTAELAKEVHEKTRRYGRLNWENEKKPEPAEAE